MTIGKLLKRSLSAVWSADGTGDPQQERGAALGRVIADLETLNGSTERDFLSVGERLAEFVATARQISSDMAALGELVAGEGGRRASELLRRILERSRLSAARAETDNQALANVRDGARRIGRTFGGFGDTVAVFRVLSSLTRIETARLGSSGGEFGILAEEVTALTESIESSGQDILTASALLHQRMQSTIDQAAALRARELQQLPSLIDGITESLESLEERHRKASAESLRQGAQYAEVSAAIEDLVGAIQFHDITRQQVEHVVLTLKRLRAQFDGDQDRSEQSFDAAAVLKLQASQLSHAEQVFASAVARLERDLDETARRVGQMAEASQAVMGSSADEQGSFFLQLEGRFTAILKVLRTCTQAEDETQAALAELSATIGQVRESAARVREIETRIHRIAINATIRAIQIGEGGNALQVVAGVMQRLALDSSHISDEVSAALDTIAGEATRLSAGAGWKPQGADLEGDPLLPEMRATILELHSSSESSYSRLNQIAALNARLHDGVQSVGTGFSAGRTFAAAIQRARAALWQISGEAPNAPVAETAAEAAPSSLDAFASHYTMQVERDVHQAVCEGLAGNRAVMVREPPAVQPEDDLGDNVELF